MKLAHVAAPALLVTALVLSGCAAPATTSSSTPPATTDSGECAEVSVVVEFGVLDEPAIEACAMPGLAIDVLADAGVSIEGTADYGDQVVCRVNGAPAPDEEVAVNGQAPFVETCATFNSVAFWALWVKTTPDAEWEFAQEGVTTQELEAGQSVGLVYTPATETIPPQG